MVNCGPLFVSTSLRRSLLNKTFQSTGNQTGGVSNYITRWFKVQLFRQRDQVLSVSPLCQRNQVRTSTALISTCDAVHVPDVHTNTIICVAMKVNMGSKHVRRAIKHKCFGTNCSSMENCLCCKYPSPVKFDEILPLLNEYPKKSLAKILIKGFTTGFKLGYSGNHI